MIITAAHCIDVNSTTPYYVSIGQHYHWDKSKVNPDHGVILFLIRNPVMRNSTCGTYIMHFSFSCQNKDKNRQDIKVARFYVHPQWDKKNIEK